jgi:YVTN family beta-propeller protein
MSTGSSIKTLHHNISLRATLKTGKPKESPPMRSSKYVVPFRQCNLKLMSVFLAFLAAASTLSSPLKAWGQLPPTGAVYVSNSFGQSVSVIDIATNTVTTTISIPDARLFGAAAGPDGSTVYVTGLLGNIFADSPSNKSVVAPELLVIDTANNTVTAGISIGGAGDIAVSIHWDGMIPISSLKGPLAECT